MAVSRVSLALIVFDPVDHSLNAHHQIAGTVQLLKINSIEIASVVDFANLRLAQCWNLIFLFKNLTSYKGFLD